MLTSKERCTRDSWRPGRLERPMDVHTSKERSMSHSWRPRETKETGETVDTNGCAHK